MFQTFYTVRVVKDGQLVEKRRFLLKDRAFIWAKDNLFGRRQVKVTQRRIFKLEVHQNTDYQLLPHDPWVSANGTFEAVFLHTSVTKQLAVTASEQEERDQMELLDQIAHSRGFNGISYTWAIFPSGRAWEGRGDRVIEAATEGFNTTTDSIVFVGNGDVFPLSALQKKAAVALINRKQKKGVYVEGTLNVRGHREVSTQGKSCPGTKITDADIAAIEKAVN